MKILLPEKCDLCPRKCGANRQKGQKGICGADDKLKVALARLHEWEEPCISGTNGSGTVFFSGCPLSCVYCQNKEISNDCAGKEISADRLCEIFWELFAHGAHNINLVTAGQYLPFVVYAVKKAKDMGMDIPFVYNTSGYETVESLKLLEGLVDIYLPDFKYTNDKMAIEYSNAPGYFDIAAKAIDEMVRQTGTPLFDDDGMMTRGVIVRQLLLPGAVENSKKAIEYLYNRFDNSIYISIMSQYTPQKGATEPLDRRVTETEYEDVLNFAESIGVENGFIQEGESASESFIPSFDGSGV